MEPLGTTQVIETVE